jgi:hypothetical protein
MIGWVPTSRTTATTAVVRLLARPDWRDGPAGDQLRTRLTSLMDDEDPVVRMLAVEGLRFAGPDHALHDAQLLAVVIDRLRGESHPHPRLMLLNWFARLLDADPAAADAHLAESATGNGVPLADMDPGGTPADDDDEALEQMVAAVVHLAVVHDTPTARELVFRWGSEPLKYLTRVDQVVRAIRDYLRSFSAPVQERAFSLLSSIAGLVADEYLRQRKGYELAPLPEVADLVTGAARLAHDIAQQVYFASDAFDARQQPATTPLTADQIIAFAAHARPLLRDLARVDHPQVVHPIVETLIHLVDVDPGGVFHDVAEAVPGRTAYVTDRVAAEELTTFLQYMLANHRGVVLGATATLEDFHNLLEQLAWAGQPSAVELAYTFSDIFV